MDCSENLGEKRKGFNRQDRGVHRIRVNHLLLQKRNQNTVEFIARAC